MRAKKLSKQESARFWNRALIPTREPKHIIIALESLYNQWMNIQKRKLVKTPTQKKKETIFSETLDDLFDVAYSKASLMIEIEEDKKFLEMQWQKGHPGYIDLMEKEREKHERQERLEARIRKKEEDEKVTSKLI